MTPEEELKRSARQLIGIIAGVNTRGVLDRRTAERLLAHVSRNYHDIDENARYRTLITFKPLGRGLMTKALRLLEGGGVTLHRRKSDQLFGVYEEPKAGCSRAFGTTYFAHENILPVTKNNSDEIIKSFINDVSMDESDTPRNGSDKLMPCEVGNNDISHLFGNLNICQNELSQSIKSYKSVMNQCGVDTSEQTRLPMKHRYKPTGRLLHSGCPNLDTKATPLRPQVPVKVIVPKSSHLPSTRPISSDVESSTMVVSYSALNDSVCGPTGKRRRLLCSTPEDRNENQGGHRRSFSQ